MKRTKTLLAIAVLLLAFASCTDNARSRRFGGESEVKLPAGEMLITATWKESDLWYLTAPMPEGYVPQTKIFRESSSMGVWEGTVQFIESK
jgi:hypothetical protein